MRPLSAQRWRFLRGRNIQRLQGSAGHIKQCACTQVVSEVLAPKSAPATLLLPLLLKLLLPLLLMLLLALLLMLLLVLLLPLWLTLLLPLPLTLH